MKSKIAVMIVLALGLQTAVFAAPRKSRGIVAGDGGCVQRPPKARPVLIVDGANLTTAELQRVFHRMLGRKPERLPDGTLSFSATENLFLASLDGQRLSKLTSVKLDLVGTEYAEAQIPQSRNRARPQVVRHQVAPPLVSIDSMDVRLEQPGRTAGKWHVQATLTPIRDRSGITMPDSIRNARVGIGERWRVAGRAFPELPGFVESHFSTFLRIALRQVANFSRLAGR